MYGGLDEDTGALRTIDARTGGRIGQSSTPDGGDRYVNGLAWSASNQLLVRTRSSTREPAAPRLVRFDRTLRELDRAFAAPGRGFSAVGEAGVNYGDTRMRVTPVAGPALVLEELRLAATMDLIPLSGKGFAAGDAVLDASLGAPVQVAAGDDDPDSPTSGQLAGVLGATTAVAGSLLALRLARRRRTHDH